MPDPKVCPECETTTCQRRPGYPYCTGNAEAYLARKRGHPFADHPWVGKTSLTGTVITPDDVAAAMADEAADAQWRADREFDDEEMIP